MPEGDTILSIAGRLRPVLVEKPLERKNTSQHRHASPVARETRADLRCHSITPTRNTSSCPRPTPSRSIPICEVRAWRIFERPFDVGRRARAAWLVLETAAHTVVQFRGPILELIRDSRLGYDPYLRRLGADILAPELDWPAILLRLRSDDPTGRSRTPCSTSARSRASATSGRTRASTSAGSTPGGRCPT